MEDFYKQFKDTYEGKEEPDYNPSDWVNLEKRLDENDKSGLVLPFPIWYLAIPFVALLGWNVWLQSTLSDQNKNFVVEESTNGHEERINGQTGPSTIVDTVFKKEIVYQTDTVYIEKAIITRTQSQDRIIYQDRIVYRDKPVFLKKDNELGWVKLNQDDIEGAYFLEAGTGTAITDEKTSTLLGTKTRRTNYLTMGSLPMFSTYLKSSSQGLARQRLAFSPQLDVEAISKRRQNQRYFRPVGVDAYVGTGLVYTSQADLTNLVSTSQHLGIKLQFAPGYSLWLEGAYQAMNFKTSSMNEDIGVPVITPPSDEFKFENAEIKRFAMQYAAGIDYSFNKSKRLRPFIGLGIAAVRYLQSDIFYDFYNATSGQEWIFEKEPASVPMTYGYGLFKAGLEYSLSRRVDLQMTGIFRRSAHDAFGNEKMFGGHLSLKAKLF